MNYSQADHVLTSRARKNIWCSPEQDKNNPFKLARITPQNGVWSMFRYQWRSIALPQPRARFHVYQIGAIKPHLLGLPELTNVWTSVPEVMIKENMLVQAYNGKGRIVPRCLCWFMVTQDGNLLLAVQKSEQKTDLTDINLEDEALFLRLYSNAYFNRPDRDNGSGIRVVSKRVSTLKDLVDFQNEVATWPRGGALLSFVNGKAVNTLNMLTVKVGDYVDIVQDTSVKYILTFDVRALREFNSELDNIRKYLLTHDNKTDTIDYVDDVEALLVTDMDANHWHGTYLHKNDERTMRQVTHRDWSLSVISITAASASNEHLRNKSLKLRLYVRNSGYIRPLELEHHRIFELYKLPLEKRLDAMLGINATVSVWRAEKLESSAYVKIMGAPKGVLSKDLVLAAYGYNAASVILGNTPSEVVEYSNQKLVFIPDGLVGNASVYEYSADGKLLGYYNNGLDNTSTARFAETAFAEVVYGAASTNLDIQEGRTGEFDINHSYRFYMADSIGGVLVSPWKDVTGTANYLIQGNGYSWVHAQGKAFRVVSNRKFLGYTTFVRPSAGVLIFDIVRQTSLGIERFDIELGQLDIFVNGYSLTEGLDYYIDGSRVFVVAKEYFVNDATGDQRIDVRYMALPAAGRGREKPVDMGFVNNGVLSDNDRFDLRDDKVHRIVVGGRVRLRKDLKFAEGGTQILIDGVENGRPYCIKDIVVPMNRFLTPTEGVEDLTQYMRERSKSVDQEVSDYMSRIYPQEPLGPINAVRARYQLYSPFLARIIDDLASGILWKDKFVEHFGDEYLREVIKPYEWLLKYDPASGEHEVDERYVVVHPHARQTYISLTMYQWRVLERVRNIYTPGVDLSSHVNVLQF